MATHSLRARLRWLVIGVLLVVLLPLSVISFRRTLIEVNELLDGRLAQSARTLDVLIQHAGLESLRGPKDGQLVVPLTGGPSYESEVGFQVFDADRHTRLVTSSLAGLAPPPMMRPGFEDVHYDGYAWRLFTLIDRTRGVLIRVGERHDSRRDITRALWLDHGLPLLFGLPLLAVLMGWAVRRGLRPLERLASDLAARAPGGRQPITLDPAPQELQPVLEALNGQFERIEDALERERRFSADVAHELRTPLASTMIHLDNVQAADDPVDREAALTHAQRGVSALARRIEQLLALARLEAGAAIGQQVSVDVLTVAKHVIEELAPIIVESAVELSLVHEGKHFDVSGYETALEALLRNLIENAMRHVPAGGQVQVALTQETRAVRIEVIDDGPGIPLERRQSVFARFHREASSRGDGYGLGLSIVKRAAELHGASIALLDSPHGQGLRVQVVIPAA